jgi:putative acetyltransferase
MFRTATPGDVERAIEIIRRSIEELCIPDHGGDQDILPLWLANKTAAGFRAWPIGSL